VRLFVEHGADVSAKEKDGVTGTSHRASQSGCYMWISHSSSSSTAPTDDPAASGIGAIPPGRWSRGQGAFLIDHGGADVASKDNNGWTSLHWASCSSHLNLVLSRVPTSAKDDYGCTRSVALNTGTVPQARYARADVTA
jgi:hypothetical protein